MKKGMLVDPVDNVGVVLESAHAGDQVQCGPVVVTLTEDISVPHKVALVDIQNGSSIIKFGAVVGYATTDILSGAHVHVHNMDSEKLMK